jgi:hypothetical protein
MTHLKVSKEILMNTQMSVFLKVADFFENLLVANDES